MSNQITLFVSLDSDSRSISIPSNSSTEPRISVTWGSKPLRRESTSAVKGIRHAESQSSTADHMMSEYALRLEERSMRVFAKRLELQQERDRKKAINDLMEAFNYLILGDEDSFWRVADSAVDRYSYQTLGEACQEITTEVYGRPSVMCALAKFLCSMELKEALPWGPLLLMTLLHHKNDVVVESAIILLDNWEDSTLVPLLRGMKFHEPWLNEYATEVANRIEAKDVLCA